jgi:chromosome partitioning protein
MRKIISVTNQKGGVGKTTTAINLAASLAAAEKRTLLIDADSQGNATSGIGVNINDINNNNLYHCMTENRPLQEAILKTQIPHLDVVPANEDLIGVELEFVSLKDREKKLRNLVRALTVSYDYVIIDCPPSLGFLTVNAMVASDYLIVPLQCEYFAMEGLGHLLKTVEIIKKYLNPTLCLGGILLTMYDSRNLLSRRVSDDVRKNFGNLVFETVIPRNVRLSESPSHGLPIILYDIKSRGAISYLELAKEIMKNGRI